MILRFLKKNDVWTKRGVKPEGNGRRSRTQCVGLTSEEEVMDLVKELRNEDEFLLSIFLLVKKYWGGVYN